MKAVIDTGTMITFSSTCLMNIFTSFVRHNKIELMVSSEVADESVWKPISSKRFSLNAARIKHSFKDNTISVMPHSSEVTQMEQQILALANSSFFTDFGPISIIQRGEAEALALAKVYGASAIFVDERTTRSLLENPGRLKQVLEKRQNKSITVDEEKVKKLREMFPSLKVFRSVDIIAMAFEQDLFDHELDHGRLELEAALYAAKFAGCAVSEKEIDDYMASPKKDSRKQ